MEKLARPESLYSGLEGRMMFQVRLSPTTSKDLFTFYCFQLKIAGSEMSAGKRVTRNSHEIFSREMSSCS